MRIFTLLLISLGVYLSVGLPIGFEGSPGGAVETTKVEDMAAETDGTEIQDMKSVPWSEWEQDEYGWKYRMGENYISNRWLERDEQFCYMGEDGYMMTDTITPDGEKVDKNGAWIIKETDLPPVPNKEKLADLVNGVDTYIGLSLTGGNQAEDMGDCYVFYDADLRSLIKTNDEFTWNETLGEIDLYVRKDVKLETAGDIRSFDAWEWSTSGENCDSMQIWRIEFDENGYVCVGWCVGAAG
ncbi:hypothetical protein GPL15_13370 [Clostridium sp. MCC353]|uniref:hypothetical protein n=1 Tax=Clostridium sp. MCC353 TaxID=2592646 RepID=UPI001C00C4CA|nr:hypothetical protein [Clostridium sp. MCC353]MBT9777495.1 hypothetical protein [Clostridium sp. MCC353]